MSSKLRVAIVSKSDEEGGGASRIAEDLAQMLLADGHESHHWLMNHNYVKPHYIQIYGGPKIQENIQRAQNLTSKLGLINVFPFEYVVLKHHNFVKNYDLVHFHDISFAVSPLTISLISRQMPTIWTMHDCSPFTGGCINPLDCKKYLKRCGDCPQLGLGSLQTTKDRTGIMHDVRKRVAKSKKIMHVAPSEWLIKTADETGFYKRKPLHVPNGIDTELFAPAKKKNARDFMGLPTDRPVILFAAGYLTDSYKGISYAIEALNSIKDLNPFILAIGRRSEESKTLLADFDYMETDFIVNDNVRSKFYSMADAFLYPSIADNLPLVVMEVMSCGVPVVAFETGGIPEIIDHDNDGYVAKQKDVESLSAGLRKALDPHISKVWGEKARENIIKNYSREQMYEKYLELYYSEIEWRK